MRHEPPAHALAIRAVAIEMRAQVALLVDEPRDDAHREHRGERPCPCRLGGDRAPEKYHHCAGIHRVPDETVRAG
ncbi:hypothetical protein X945_5885 [Burkholderia pseudomallei ABCPW 107]|nr:hypothetical protein X977_5756 [Burkholderia pseudomallei MSHR7504]KGS35029.1 hypothetical protein X945_5885 [Burkholderia pseudomallei ABCPW 107]